MPTLSVEDGFDVHDYRHGLKLRKQTDRAMHLENRDDFVCPACGEVFDKLFVTEAATTRFGNPSAPFCLARTDSQLLLLTH
jgi:hypothetical protein